MKTFDAIIIGAGQAGPSLAEKLSEAGRTVAFVERKLFGGTCVNTGCTPTKAMVASAYAAHLASRASEFGLELGGPVRVDMGRVMARVDAIVAKSRTGVEGWIRCLKGCTVYEGHARFEGPDSVRVGDELLTAPQVFINVGGRATVPDMPGISSVPYLTNSSILKLKQVPEHLVVIGGSYIGLEFGQIFRRLGAKVTVIEKVGRLISREDEDISAAVMEILEAEGIDVRVDSTCISFAPHVDGVEVGIKCDEGEPSVVASQVLLAVGRRPNTDDLGLDKAGVVTDGRGYITVDDELRTNVPGIWALGDCNGRGAFTHTSFNDFEIVAANVLGEAPRCVSDRISAYALYTDPPLGRAGMSEGEARKSGRPLLIGKMPMTRVGRAVEKGETKGFMKIVVDASTKEILGAAILGVGGDEAIHGVLDMMYAKAGYDVLQRSVGIHPTVSELIPTMLGEMQPG